MDSKYNIKNITNLKMQNVKTGEIYDMPCESISIASDFNGIDFDKVQTLNFEVNLKDSLNIRNDSTTATINQVDVITNRINKIENTLESNDFITACKAGKRIGDIMVNTSLSAEELGKALKVISKRFKEYQKEKEDIFLETLNKIKIQSEELVKNIYEF